MTEQKPPAGQGLLVRMRGHRFLVVIGIIEVLMIGLALVGFGQTDWWKAIELGVIEGVTEFLPISSTGHLLIASDLLRFRLSEQEQGTFEIFIQLGAVIAVAGFYARDLLAQAQTVVHNRTTQRFWLAIFIAFLPAAIIGLLLHSWIKAVLFSPPVIAGALIVGGIVFIGVEQLPRKWLPARVCEPEQVSLLQALGIGFAQVLAMIPGTSRSGASIVGGMLAGLDRKTATTFSFYLAIPTLGAATVFELLTSIESLSLSDMGYLLVGLIVSLVIAWMSIGWLLRYVSTNSFVAFGIYRILAGTVIVVLIALNRFGGGG
jgi:undecaprenyl-diphosphatase